MNKMTITKWNKNIKVTSTKPFDMGKSKCVDIDVEDDYGNSVTFTIWNCPVTGVRTTFQKHTNAKIQPENKKEDGYDVLNCGDNVTIFHNRKGVK